jgi:hypothetical protein
LRVRPKGRPRSRRIFWRVRTRYFVTF